MVCFSRIAPTSYDAGVERMEIANMFRNVKLRREEEAGGRYAGSAC